VHEKYGVTVVYLHLGSAEELASLYTVYDTTSAASTVMADVKTAYGASPTSPKLGDQVLYYEFRASGAAPHAARVFVRVGSIVAEVVWANKDAPAKVDQLARVARPFVANLKNLGKLHPSASPAATKELPPPGLDITLLGTAHLPVESFVVLTGSGLPDNVAALLRQSGIDSFTYGDYALNADTHMEVQTALMAFPSAADAESWAKAFGPGTADSAGIYSQYVPGSGSPAAGAYHYVFASGVAGVYMICKSSVEGEAASRECEDPMHRTAVGWQFALQGIG
jgi:hypothetical protein